MDIIFIHGNYPAQFKHLAAQLGAQATHRVYFITAKEEPCTSMDGVNIITFKDAKESRKDLSSDENILINQVKRGKKVSNILQELRANGVDPKIIFFHAGNGLSLYLNTVFPKAKTVGIFEWYFSNRCATLILNQQGQKAYELISSRNISIESELSKCTAGVVATHWQKSQFPKALQNKLHVIFDGIDLDFFKDFRGDIDKHDIKIQGEDCEVIINTNDKLITYATRGMEPLRGFPQFLKALPKVLRGNPTLKVIIGGRDRSAYGPPAPSHEGSWKQRILAEIGEFEGKENIYFPGLMDYNNYRLMLNRTDLHCYFTLPYVTSWSLFEAYACGAPILTNSSEATTGVLSFHAESIINDIEELYTPKGAEQILRLLNNKRIQPTPKLPEIFSLTQCLKTWQTLINQILTAAE